MAKFNTERTICVTLTPEAVTALRTIACEKQSTVAAVGRTFIQDGLKGIGRPVREHVPYETLRGPKKRASAQFVEASAA